MSYGFAEAKHLVIRELDTQIVLINKGSPHPLNNPLLLGPVGGGKSSIAREVCEHYGLTLVRINCGENSDATDVTGLPIPDRIRTLRRHGTTQEKAEAQIEYTEWVLNKAAARACVEPTFLFFDDLDKAPGQIQSALLGITEIRHFRDKPVHPGTLIMGAGNRIQDDALATEISESLRTRMTVIEMEPDLASFTEYGRNTGEIHDSVLGFLQSKPEYLHKHQEGVYRFPTPRGWWEVSQQFELFPDPTAAVFKTRGEPNWKGIVSRKCGDPTANDFWAWFTLVSQIDVDILLTQGDVSVKNTSIMSSKTIQFASIYAAAHRLNQTGMRKTYVGLEKFVKNLDAEMRIAFAIQLNKEVTAQISNDYKPLGAALLNSFIGVGTSE